MNELVIRSSVESFSWKLYRFVVDFFFIDQLKHFKLHMSLHASMLQSIDRFYRYPLIAYHIHLQVKSSLLSIFQSKRIIHFSQYLTVSAAYYLNEILQSRSPQRVKSSLSSHVQMGNDRYNP